MSDPVRAFLFVLVRDPEKFYGSTQEKEVLQLCKDSGFTAFWNLPRKTVQEGCTYTPAATEDHVEVVAPAVSVAAAAADAGVDGQAEGDLLGDLFGSAIGIGATMDGSN